MTGGRTAARGFPWLLSLCAAPALALLVGLGVWQVQRLAWKTGLIAEAQAAAALPPAPIRAVFDDRRGLDFRTVRLECPGLAAAPFVEMRTVEAGEPGVRLISACRPAGFGFPFLVDRGFVPEEDRERPPVAIDGEAAGAVVHVEGQLRLVPPPGRLTPAPMGRLFFGRDVAGMSAALGLQPPAAPHVVFALNSTNPDWAALRPSAPPAAFSNNHLGYAITWFGLAIALAAVYVALLRKRLTS